MTETTNFHLKKPDDTDNTDQRPFNDNMDIIDQALANRYTKSEVDEQESVLLEQITGNKSALTELVDGGAKNLLTQSDFSGTAQVEIPIKIPAGTYVIYRSNLTSSDTDATACLCRFYDDSGGTNVQRASVGLARGEAKSTVITVTGDTTFMRIYASDSAAHSTGDTVTGTDFMVCTKAAWDISHDFQPYRPTYQELYDMVLALQQT